ncbi:6319_t:CDS:1, partial [Dentiscutata erythropus]
MYIPGSNVAIDKMMIRFSGRSKHTFRIKNKPISEGYKIISLCEKGYTYIFVLESRVENNNEIPSISGLNKTGSLVSHLVIQLSNSRAYNIYMDNYFASVPLFNYLRIKGYSACGTVRTNSAMFPKELKVEKSIRLNWDTLAGVVVNNVLVIFWMDNGPVHMLSTIHGIKGN